MSHHPAAGAALGIAILLMAAQAEEDRLATKPDEEE